MAGCFAAFALLYMGFTKLFPIISIWELEPRGRGAHEPRPRPPALEPAGGLVMTRIPLAAGRRALLAVAGAGAFACALAAAADATVPLSIELPDNPTAGARAVRREGLRALPRAGRRRQAASAPISAASISAAPCSIWRARSGTTRR